MERSNMEAYNALERLLRERSLVKTTRPIAQSKQSKAIAKRQKPIKRRQWLKRLNERDGD
jgi:hypothetical protein